MKHCAVILACGCLLGTTALHADDRRGQAELDPRIAGMAAQDPDSPAVLQARLDRVDVLLEAGDGCDTRLTAVQSAFKDAAGAPALSFLLPLGPARLASLEYEVHRAQARCAADPAGMDRELREAAAAAQRSVDLYRDALDYPSMAVMQFNVAVTQRLLGNSDASIAALSTAVDMDHAYGLLDDAGENEQLLAKWRAPAASAPPAAQAANPPHARSVTLRFAWQTSDADETVELSTTYLAGGHLAHASASRSMRMHVRPSVIDGHPGWRVSQETAVATPLQSQGFTPGEVFYGVALPATHTFLGLAPVDVSADGDLRGFMRLAPTTLDIRLGARDMMRAAAGKIGSDMAIVGRALDAEITTASVAGQAEETYSLETGAWIGATLQQGVWYQMSAGLSLPGLIDTGMQHDVEFAYTRDVPCKPGDAAPACVEIVMHATPKADELGHLMGAMSSLLQTTRYWSTTYVRLITDPRSLAPHSLDVRRYWHIFGRPGDRSEPQSGMERVVTAYRYLPTARPKDTAPAKPPAR